MLSGQQKRDLSHQMLTAYAQLVADCIHAELQHPVCCDDLINDLDYHGLLILVRAASGLKISKDEVKECVIHALSKRANYET